jgi:xylulokinase
MAIALGLEVTPGRVALSLVAGGRAMAGLGGPVADPTGVVSSRADATGGHLAVALAPGGGTLVEVVRDVVGAGPEPLHDLVLGVDVPAGSPLVVVPTATMATVTGLGDGTSRAGFVRAAYEGIACAALDALDRIAASGGVWLDDEPLRLAAPAADRTVHARLLADLSGRAVQPAPTASLAAAGACIQAAAVLHEAPPGEIAADWALGRAALVEPEADEQWAKARRAAHRTP